MVSLLSLSSSLQGNSSVCTCVCAQCFGIFCWFGYFKFSILLCACYPAFITKGYIALSSLISALAVCVFLSGACIPCPASLLQHTFSGCSSILLKDTQQVDAQHRKDQVRGGEGRVEERSHNLCRP